MKCDPVKHKKLIKYQTRHTTIKTKQPTYSQFGFRGDDSSGGSCVNKSYHKASKIISGGKCNFFPDINYNKLNNLQRVKAHKLSHYALSVRLTDLLLLHKRCKTEDEDQAFRIWNYWLNIGEPKCKWSFFSFIEVYVTKLWPELFLYENRLHWLNLLLGHFLQAPLNFTKLWIWSFKFPRKHSQAFTNKRNIYHVNKPAQKALVVMFLVQCNDACVPWYC